MLTCCTSCAEGYPALLLFAFHRCRRAGGEPGNEATTPSTKLSVQVICKGVVAGNIKRKEGLTYTGLNLCMCWKDVFTLARKPAPAARQSTGPGRALGQPDLDRALDGTGQGTGSHWTRQDTKPHWTGSYWTGQDTKPHWTGSHWTRKDTKPHWTGSH